MVKKIKKKSFDEDLVRNKYFSGQLILRLLQKGLLEIKKTQQTNWNAEEITKVNLSTSSSVLDETEGAGCFL